MENPSERMKDQMGVMGRDHHHEHGLAEPSPSGVTDIHDSFDEPVMRKAGKEDFDEPILPPISSPRDDAELTHEIAIQKEDRHPSRDVPLPKVFPRRKASTRGEDPPYDKSNHEDTQEIDSAGRKGFQVLASVKEPSFGSLRASTCDLQPTPEKMSYSKVSVPGVISVRGSEANATPHKIAASESKQQCARIIPPREPSEGCLDQGEEATCIKKAGPEIKVSTPGATSISGTSGSNRIRKQANGSIVIAPVEPRSRAPSADENVVGERMEGKIADSRTSSPGSIDMVSSNESLQQSRPSSVSSGPSQREQRVSVESLERRSFDGAIEKSTKSLRESDLPTATAIHVLEETECEDDASYGRTNSQELVADIHSLPPPPPQPTGFIATAIEYVPPLKPYLNPRIQRRSRARLCCLLLIVFIAAIIIAVAIVYRIKPPPPSVPTCEKDDEGYFSRLADISDEADLCNGLSKQYQAYKWMMEEDAQNLSPNDSNFLQRYVLALFYFSTGGDGWDFCNEATSGNCTYECWNNDGSEDSLLCQSSKCTGGACSSSAFLSDTHECQWYGTVCNEKNRVRGLYFGANNLTGTIPTELQHLRQLDNIWIPFNKVHGSLPPSVGSLSQLTSIVVRFNQLTGGVPESYYDLRKLKVLDVKDNCLSGPISPSIARLSSLEAAKFSWNSFTGTLPSEVSSMNNLQLLHVDDNRLEGPIPRGLGNQPLLREVLLYENSFSGTLPASLGNITNESLPNQVVRLNVGSNKLRGTIPDALFSWRMNWLDLSNNQLTGALPLSVADGLSLVYLDVRGNRLSGSIPSALGNLTNLRTVALQDNDFNGTMPESMCKLHARLPIGGLFPPPFLASDCGGGGSDIFCPDTCCTVCCDNGVCQLTESSVTLDVPEYDKRTTKSTCRH